MEKISIIVPIYNIENYIGKNIQSIINQTYTNIEILLVNDGSTDSSFKICQNYAKQDNRIILLDKPNGGLSDARNYGLEKATGEYILFVDGDDYIHHQMVELLYTCLQKSSADIAYCNYLSVYENDSITDAQFTPDILKSIITYSNSEVFSKLFKRNTNVILTITWNKLYRKALFNEIRFPVGKIHEDDFTSYKLLDSAAKISYIDAPLYYYLKRRDSITGAGVTQKTFHKVEAYVEITDYCIAGHKEESAAAASLLLLHGVTIKKYQRKNGCDSFLNQQKALYKKNWIKYGKYIRLPKAMLICFKVTQPDIYKKIYQRFH